MFTGNLIRASINISQFLFLQTAVHIPGGSPTHHQEHNTVSTASCICQTVLLTAAIVEVLKLFHESGR